MTPHEGFTGAPPGPAHLLVIDDEDAICFAFKRYFEARGFRVRTAGTGADGRQCFRAQRPDVVFLDIRLPDCDGLDLLGSLRAEYPDLCVIIITAYGSLDAVARAIRGKAFDCLVKPLDLDRAGALVEQFLRARGVTMTTTPPRRRSREQAGEEPVLVGRSAVMQEVFKSIGRAAGSDSAVLIAGATGTGKELAARAVHRLSRRRDGPFVPVNCGALPETLVESELFGYARGAFTGALADKPGRFELAQEGTLFLDEIGELPPAAQVKLLRFLDSHIVERLGDVTPRQLDVRIVAATNRSLADAVANGGFRADLYYRVAVIEIGLPPLRERPQDIRPLAEHFLRQYGNDTTPTAFSPEAVAILQTHAWPGNVRELRNVVEHAMTMATGGIVLPLHLPPALQAPDCPARAARGHEAPDPVSRYLEAVGTDGDGLIERVVTPLQDALVRRVLTETGGNQSAAADRLGVHRNTLRRRLATPLTDPGFQSPGTQSPS